MIFVIPGLYVRISQFEGANAPHPLPLRSGFSMTKAYKVLGVHAASETSEAYLILANDDQQIWFISNRHLRAHAVLPECQLFHLHLPGINVRAA